MSNKVKLMRLLTGEYVVGEVSLNKNANTYKVKNPVLLVLGPGENPNSVRVELTPYLGFTEDKEVEFERYHVVYTVTPNTQLLNQYNKLFGSGIILPENTKILT